MVVLLSILAACGKGDSKPDPAKDKEKDKEKAKEDRANDIKANPVGKEPVGACVGMEGGTLCSEAWGRLSTVDDVKKNCEASTGAKFVPACPRDQAVARCVTEKGTAVESHTVFYGPKMTKEQAAAMCKAPSELRDP